MPLDFQPQEAPQGASSPLDFQEMDFQPMEDEQPPAQFAMDPNIPRSRDQMVGQGRGLLNPQVVNQQEPSMMDFLLGAPRAGQEQSPLAANIRKGISGLEAGVATGTNLASYVPAALGTVVSNINDIAQGKKPNSDTFSNLTKSLSYEPFTEQGRGWAEQIGQSGFMQSLMAAGAVHGSIPSGAPSVRAKLAEAVRLNAVAEQAKRNWDESINGSVKERVDALRKAKEAQAAADKSKEEFIAEQNAAGIKTNEAIPPEVRAAQETLNAQDANGNTAFLPEKDTAVDHTAQLELPLTNENLPNKAELQGDLFGDQQPMPRPAEAPLLSPDYSRSQQEVAKAGEIDAAAQARDVDAAQKRDQIEQMYQQRAMSAAADKNREALQQAKDVRDTQLQQLEQTLREQAYTPDLQGQGPKTRAAKQQMYIPKSQRGNAPVINHLATLIEDTAKKGSKALEDLHGRLFSMYANGGYKDQTLRDAATNVIHAMVKEQQKEQYVENVNKPTMGAIGPNGETHIPSGTVVMATHGIKFKEPTRATIVGEKQMQINGQPHRFPVADFGNGEVRTLGYGDVKQVFNGPMRGPKSQRGSAPIINDIAGSIQDNIKAVGDILKENFFAENMKPENIIAKGMNESDSKSWNYIEAGGTLAAMKRNSTPVKEVVRILQNTSDRAEFAQKTFVHPAREAFKRLSKKEIEDLAHVIRLEAIEGVKVSPEEVLGLGLSEKQLKAYTEFRDMRKKAYEAQNEQRLASGLPAISEKEFGYASRWKGDFRRPVYAISFDKDGVTPLFNKATGEVLKHKVYHLAADSTRGLEKQWKALKEKFPEYEAGPDTVVRSMGGGKDPKALLSTMIDLFGRDDPATQRIKEWAEDMNVNESEATLGQTKHFERKYNVGGFVGDRPGKNPTSEAVAFFQEQLNYANNAFKWAEYQKTAKDVSKIINDPALIEKQPNNMSYLQDYTRNHLGMGEARWVRAMEDAIRTTGISPHTIANVVGGSKTLFILQKMAGSLGFALSNVVQYVNNIPHLVDISKNPLEITLSATVGIPAGMLMATTHYLSAKGVGVYKAVGSLPNGNFLVKAMKYAEDNGVTHRSILDESPIENSFNALGKVENLAGKSLGVPETYLRSTAYMTYVQLLQATDKFKNDLELFRHAKERVDAAMGDYRQTEKALGFSKLGIVGNALNTLQTYPMNWYQQLNYFGREAKKGNALPLMAMLGTQYMVAGAMGIPGFNDANKLFELIKGWLPDNAWYKVKDVSLPELIMKHGGESSLYGPLSTKTGVAMTSRVTAPAGSEMLQSPFGPAIDIAKQVGAVGHAVINPTDKDAWAQVAMNSVPTGLQGLMETGPLKSQTSVPELNAQNQPTGNSIYGKSTDVAAHQGMVTRTPEEETLRKLGLRSQREVFTKDMAYMATHKQAEAQKRSMELPNKIYAAARQGNLEKTKDLITLYKNITGNDFTDAQMQKQVLDEYTNAVQRAYTGAKTLQGILAVKQMREFLQGAQSAN